MKTKFICYLVVVIYDEIQPEKFKTFIFEGTEGGNVSGHYLYFLISDVHKDMHIPK